jgi:small-conductance mechanosensitive channel
MNYLEHNYSAFPVLSLLLLGLLVYFVLRLIRFAIPYIAKNRNFREWITQYFSLFELFVWITFLLWFLPYLVHRNIYAGVGLGLILLAIFIWIAWFGLRNLIAGFIFKSNNGLKIGQLIQIDDERGTIVKLGYRNIILDTTKGNLVNIPYSQITNKSLIKINSTEQRHSITFKLKTPKTKNIKKITTDISAHILMHPRCSITEKPNIELLEEQENEMIFSIKIFAVENKYLSTIEEDIKEWAKNLPSIN